MTYPYVYDIVYKYIFFNFFFFDAQRKSKQS